MSRNVITPPAILSYPYLAKPQESDDGGKSKYSATFVLTAGRDITALEEAIHEAAESLWPKKSKAMFASGALRYPIRRDSEDKGYPAGSVFFSARSEQQPGLVLLPPEPNAAPPRVIQDAITVEFYPGAIVRASVKAYPYDNKSKGVGFALNNIQKLAEGARLDGRKSAEDDFDVDVDLSDFDGAESDEF